MLSLNIGFSKKQQGNEPYSSIGASCNLSVEASDELVKQPELLQKRMAFLFQEARRSVDNQIQNGSNGKPAPSVETGTPTPRVNPGNGGQSNGGSNGNGEKLITPKQVKFLIGLLSKRYQGGVKAFEAKIQQDGINSIRDLTRKQASTLIDDLAGNNGGGQ